MSGPEGPAEGLGPVELDALSALALGATPRARTWVWTALSRPALRRPGTAAPTQEALRVVFARLKAIGLVEEDRRRPDHVSVAREAYGAVYDELLSRVPLAALREALAHADGYRPLEAGTHRMPSGAAAIARVRVEAYDGMPFTALAPLLARGPFAADDESLFEAAVVDCVDGELAARLDAGVLFGIAIRTLRTLGESLRTGIALDAGVLRSVVAQGLADFEPNENTESARWVLAHDRLDATGADRRSREWVDAFASLVGPAIAQPGDEARARAFAAAAQARRGEWSQAEALFDLALADLRKATGRRRELLPPNVALAYVECLLAQQSPAHLEKALKFCLAEGGKRTPVLTSDFGVIALAIQMRQGAVPRDAKAFQPYGAAWGDAAARAQPATPRDHVRWLMRAWLKEGVQAEPLSPGEAAAAQHLLQACEACGLEARAEQLRAALGVLAGEQAPPWFFVSSGLERWQVALGALRALGGTPGEEGAAGAEAEAATRLVWVIEPGANGAVLDIVPHTQKRGARGWGKPAALSLPALQRGAQVLSTADAEVVRVALRLDSFTRGPRLDLAAAIGALLKHPHVAFAGAPEAFVELVEGHAELEVVDEGERLRVRMQPGVQVPHDGAAGRWGGTEAERKALEALRLVSVWPDGPQRARVIRLTDAQKRVAQLLGADGLDVPRHGAAQLQEVLAGLGSHFRIHADDARTAHAAREVGAEARLRAELQPVGDGLQLRLVAAPFGAEFASEGPRLVPGRGRARIVATLRGEHVGVQRDLVREREHLEAVIDACPMLIEPASDAPCEWQLDAPEDALALLERLQRHHAIAALDWPQGRPVRVATAAMEQLALKVRTHENWLGVQGELRIDEDLVVGLQQLIGLAAQGRSRFLPLGDGRFVALTQELRERIADLAAVVEAHAARGQELADLRVPAAAAPWLQAATEGAQVEHDAAYAARLQALDDARRIVPALPSTLQAELRPYQAEGFEWAMRLAAAGLGACLADDMGLGKTLQAIAVLLARAANGAALVVVPTSLIGNWRAECARFAPALRVHIHAEGGGAAARRERIEGMGRHDLLLVSYPMLQIDAEAFAAREWATLVLDEAQAIKNAAAKRSQAVFALRAAFRLAMSGTPIENRLGELWSVMRACNPGLLGTAKRFNERFANLIERQSDRQAQRILKRLIAPFILRRTKAQVLADLPPRTELVLEVLGDDTERAHYEALRREALVAAERSLAGDAPGQAHLNILAGLTRLRRAACDPRLVTPTLKAPGAKVQAFADLAAELVANGHKALVFSQFVDFLALLREPLDAAGIAYQYLDGSTPAAERTRRVEAFQEGEGDLFLISLKAGGFGLNLTVADYVVIADPWWNPAAEEQASGRAHRIGQQRPVTVYRLVHQGTLEEKIIALHQVKRELADGILESEEGVAAPVPMARELLALMRGDGGDDDGGDPA
jgi:superfamily II DNA or RNA helicase